MSTRIDAAFLWLGGSALGRFMRDYTWPSSAAVVLHLLGLILVGGPTIASSVAGLRRHASASPALNLGGELRVFFWAGLVLAAITGVALIAAKAENYPGNPIFWTKLALLVPAIAAAAWLQRRPPAGRQTPARPRDLRTLYALNLALWIGVAAAGRGIGIF